jgi:hypothetical protein
LGPSLVAARLHAKQAAERVDARTNATPVVVAVPLELRLHGLGHAPTVGETELREHGTSGDEAEVLDEIVDAHRPVSN